MSTFSVTHTQLPGVAVVERGRREDHRGFFSRLFCADELRAAGFDTPVAQINHTLTLRRGALRGLHFQHPPHAEIKLVSVLRGEILDVALDVRQGSPTFLRWHAEILSAENRRSLLIPRGFAHGFQALAENCELLYLHSCAYAPSAEAGLRATDPGLGIHWPLPITDISPRDATHPLISSGFLGVEL
jgi:dTDP-4-dehydrorhamnose 3,5-epimerase